MYRNLRHTEKGQKLEDGLYGEDFYTYEEAQEEAIKQVLKNKIWEIINK